ncbi:MAG: hypothetical protein M1608_15125 [Candidatus Omnitrophica bacterium]|nr:hypothetical protein [Candidatus Omnitrophota bacterium]
MPSPYLTLAFLAVFCFSLATRMQVWFLNWSGNRLQSASILKVLLGDSRRLFANQSFVEADVYFHGGYYPSLFDRPPGHVPAVSTAEIHGGRSPHNDLPNFLIPSDDWIARFGRHFVPSEHIHLDKPSQVGEILPWLWLSAELDPNRVQTYTVASFWLRRMGKVNEAEQFLRQGWRANPDSYAILFELGSLYDENRHDPIRARNLWELALRKWQAQETVKPKPDNFAYEQITAHLARLEEREGNRNLALHYLDLLKKVSPDPAAIQHQINRLQRPK